IGSISSRYTIGMKTGNVISIMLTWSTNRPRNIKSDIIPARIAKGESCWPKTADMMPSVAPEKLRICENVVAPRDNEKDHSGDCDGPVQRLCHGRNAKRPVDGRKRHRGESPERSGFRGRRDAARHGA